MFYCHITMAAGIAYSTKMKSAPTLSIIIPCYNCSTTLFESVTSVFSQSLTVPYEVILVNDSSTDNTLEIIHALKKRFTFSLFTHTENRGGGAARNTGISHAKGKYIICHDSDNICDGHSLQLMLEYCEKMKCDGVLFQTRKYFVKHKEFVISHHINTEVHKRVEFCDFFKNKNILFDNFLCKRDVVHAFGGYPEYHDFDTQGFELRFLSKGFRAYVCPGTVIFHRQREKELSYFERAYAKGEFSLNYFFIFEEIAYLFSEKIRQRLLTYNIQTHTSLEKNIVTELVQLYKKNPKSFFTKNVEKYLNPVGIKHYMTDTRKSTAVGDIWCRAIYFSEQHNFQKAVSEYFILLESGFSSSNIYMNIVRCSAALDTNFIKVKPQKRLKEVIDTLHFVKQQNARVSYVELGLKKMLRTLGITL